ncbi:MAG: CvpA family protein [Clostridia bacterium]|nr:CvpA family protein [Clostridia bacterium]
MFNLLASVVSLGSLNVALIDLIMLGVLLLALLFGAMRGFLGQILSLLGGLAALLLAIFLCKHLAGFIMEKVPAITNAVSGTVNKIFGIEEIVATGGKEEIIKTLQTTKIPSFLHSIVANAIVESGAATKLSMVLTEWALTAISFVAIFIVALIVFLIVKRFFKAIAKLKGVGAVNKILGAILMAAKALLLSVIVIMVMSLFMDMNSLLTPTLDNGEQVNSVFNGLITKIMEANFIQNLLT